MNGEFHDLLEEIGNDDEGLEIGADGYQVVHDGFLTCVFCREEVPAEQIFYYRPAGDWTKEYCRECYRAARLADWETEMGGAAGEPPETWYAEGESHDKA